MSDFENPIIIVDGELVGVAGIISVEKPQQCDLCGEVAELRPYGPNQEMVCYPCGMKDERATKRGFLKRLDGIHDET